MRRLLILMLCLSLHGLARGQTTYNYRYWFDGDVSTLQSGSQTGNSWHWDIPVGSFSDWFHLFHLQIQDAEGKWSITRTMPFVIVPSEIIGYSTDITGGHYRYWFDNDINTSREKTATSNLLQLEIPMSGMDNWFHVIHFQVSDKNGNWSSVYTKSFAVVPEVLMKLDGTPDVTGGMYRYWLDADVRAMKGGSMSSNLLPLEIPVEGLSDWFHIIHFQVSDKDGNWSATKTSPFVVLPKEDRRITRYSYWVNDIASNYQTQEIPSPQDEFSLVSLLPVETQPIRSKKFQFSVKDSQPIIYAKNDFHALFIDGCGRQVIEEREYVDEQVNAAVEPVGELEPTQTFDKVPNNTIRWYTVNVEAGDTLAFKSSQATTIQLFSPSGQELYKAEGSTSVAYGGCHTWESGTHYLAVHDVKGTKPTMVLDYMHMNKYDVVDWDAHIVGNGGYNSISFRGNGFHDLLSVDLILGSSVITSDSIGHENDAETSIRFDFEGAKLGEYGAVFHFADDDLEVDNCLTVEEATPFEFEGTAFFADNFLFGKGNTYTFRYHNKSNMTAYDVPFAVYVFTPEHLSDSIFDPHTYIKVGGYDLEKHYRKLLGDYYTDSLDAIIQAKKFLTGDTYFMLDDTIPEYLADYPYARHTYIQATLHPDEIKTFTVHVNTMTNMHVYLWAPNVWENEISPIKRRNIRRAGSAMDGICTVINNKNRLCEENERMIRAGVDPIYDVNCEDYKPKKDCPENKPGGKSKGSGPKDPNDIYGYFTETGSKFIADSVDKVDYIIEFENDTEFATASAHKIIVKDTLDSQYFDLSAFVPTKVRIGSHDLSIEKKDITSNSGVISFVKTIDLRPEINSIAQVEGEYNEQTGIATWTLTTLDPMTMESSDDLMQGILPVNHDGTSGIGEVMFEIGVKANKGDGTQIANRAGIVFDYEDPIITPTWVNTVDAIAPTSTILGAIQAKTDTLTLRIAGEDNLSGVWRYDVYAKIGQGSLWEKVAENVPAIQGEGETETFVDVRIFEGIEYGFMVMATDSAGNMERKAFEAELELSTVKTGDANGDGVVDALDVILATSYYLGKDVYLNFAAADVVADGEINSLDVIAIQNIYLSSSKQALNPRKRIIKSDRTNNK